MPIELLKPIRRRATGRFHRQPFTVGLLPGDVLEFREHRRRRTYLIELATVFDIAVKRTVAAERAAKRLARRNGRQQVRP